MNDYLARLLEDAGIGSSPQLAPVVVPGWGDKGSDKTWYVRPLTGDEEAKIGAYVNRTAQVREVLPDKVRDVLLKTAQALLSDDEDERNQRIMRALALIEYSIANTAGQENARLSATIYFSARNQMGQLLFAPAGTDNESGHFEAIDALAKMPLAMREAAERAIREHIISPLQLATLNRETELLKEQLEKKSAATPAGESQPT